MSSFPQLNKIPYIFHTFGAGRFVLLLFILTKLFHIEQIIVFDNPIKTSPHFNVIIRTCRE